MPAPIPQATAASFSTRCSRTRGLRADAGDGLLDLRPGIEDARGPAELDQGRTQRAGRGQGEELVGEAVEDEVQTGEAEALAGEDERLDVGEDLDERNLDADAQAGGDRLGAGGGEGGEALGEDAGHGHVDVQGGGAEPHREEAAAGNVLPQGGEHALVEAGGKVAEQERVGGGGGAGHMGLQHGGGDGDLAKEGDERDGAAGAEQDGGLAVQEVGQGAGLDDVVHRGDGAGGWIAARGRGRGRSG